MYFFAKFEDTAIKSVEEMFLKSLTWGSVRNALTRRKLINFDEVSNLAKVLGTVDLVSLGIGSTLGAGIYVLAGDVAKKDTGPAIIVSFFIAAAASILAGLCYAEFGARVPKAGSAYVYTYVCIGEFCAFIIGWNLILEYLIGSATVTKAIFTYLDELMHKEMSSFFTQNVPITFDGLSNYFDFFSLGFALVFAVGIAFGVKESSLVNNVCTLVNLSVVSTVIISGFWRADLTLWNIPKKKVPSGFGDGGFAPYGVKGIIKGAARCFFAFIGFDCIATAGEEAKNPQKSIPIGVVMSLVIVFLAYFGASAMITLMLPYYEQDANAPLTHLYDVIGWKVLKYLVTVGALCGLLASLLGAMFPLPRIIYAMANDGLIFKFLSNVHPKFHTPFLGTLVGGIITGVLASLFDVEKLSSMMSIGTLFAYSMVAACVLVLRYGADDISKKEKNIKSQEFKMQHLFFPASEVPTKQSAHLVSSLILLFGVLVLTMSWGLLYFEKNVIRGEIFALSITIFTFACLILILVIISFQPKSEKSLTFSVPFVPWIPGFSIGINIYLMTTLPGQTWTYYLYWMGIGLTIYFLYGIWNSKEGKNNNNNSIEQKADGVYQIKVDTAL